MKAVTSVATFVVTTLLAGTTAAATFDYRAEYKHKDKTYAHRFKLGDSTNLSDDLKLSFGIEQKFHSYDSSKYWDQVVAGDSELEVKLRYALDNHWYLEPGMPITFGDDDEKTTYKPQFRVGYKSSFGLTTALRYRHEFQVYSDGAGTKTLTDGTSVSVAGKTVEQGKWTLTGSYRFKDKDLKKIRLGYEINFNQNYDDVRLSSDDNDYDWDAGLIIGYQMGKFRPYVELWTVDYGSTGDRQARTRLGMKYSF